MAMTPMQYEEVLVESKYKEYSPEKTFAASSGEIIIETIDVSKTGYTPIGVVGIYFWGSSNQQMVIDTFRVSGNNNVEVAYRHVPDTQYCVVSRIYVEVLYKKN